MSQPIIAVHGGAGTLRPDQFSPEKEKMYRQGLEAALTAGGNLLQAGGTALDAVEAAVKALEDNPLFNAGRGSVFTYDGSQEMDASIMCGQTREAGAVAAVKNVRNPIALARLVLHQSPFVLLSGSGAADFARQHNLPSEPDEYFFDQYRFDQWQQLKGTENVQLDHADDKKFGTVGAVALDQHGNLAAATSTGGLTNKRYGRLGDTPVIGAGTYANNRTCAVSCTGDGEYFLRAVVAYDVSCLMEYAGLSLAAAAAKVVQEKLKEIKGEGGLIAIDPMGNVTLPFNSEGMYRGYWQLGQAPVTAIFRD